MSSRYLGFLFSQLVIALALLVTWRSIYTGGEGDLAGRFDIYRVVGPVSYYMDFILHSGEIPYWNPLTFCGMPFAANPISAFFYPPNLLRSLLTFDPTPYKSMVGWIVMTAAHLLVAGAGMVALGRRHKLTYPAAILAAFVFIFSAAWVRRVGEFHFITMVAWLPILLLLIEYLLDAPRFGRKLSFALAAGLIFGMTLLTGSFNIAPYLGLSLGAYALAYRLVNLRVRPWQATLRLFAAEAVLLVFMLVLGAIVALPLLLPGMELTSFSARAAGGDYDLLPPEFAGSWWDLLQILVRYPGLKWEVENIRGAGVGAFVLVLLGLAYKPWRHMLPFAALAFVLFDCSMGRPWPFAALIDTLSPIQMVSSNRAFDFALVPFGILAGMGAQAVTHQLKGWRGIWRELCLAAGAVMLATLYPLLGPDQFMPVGNIAIVIPALLLLVVLLAGRIPAKPLWCYGMAFLVLAETLAWNKHYVPHILFRLGHYQYEGEFKGVSNLWSDNRRSTDDFPNRHLYTLRGVMNGYEPVHIHRVREVVASPQRLRLYRRLVTPEEATQDNLRGNLFLKRSAWLARDYVQGSLPPHDQPFPATTTVYLQDAPAEGLEIPRLEEKDVPRRDTSENTEIIPVRNPETGEPYTFTTATNRVRNILYLPPLPRPEQHTLLRVRYTATGAGSILVRVRDGLGGDWEWSKTIHMRKTNTPRTIDVPLPDFTPIKINLNVQLKRPETSASLQSLEFVVDRADENSLLHIVRRTANTITLRTDALPGPRILTLLDAMYPGWSATVDGIEAPIYLANNAFKAVALPAGAHEIIFTYRPYKLWIGCAASGAATLLSLLTIFLLARRHRREVATPPPAP